jgi:O-antigen/teichoic acid export membrane protein
VTSVEVAIFLSLIFSYFCFFVPSFQALPWKDDSVLNQPSRILLFFIPCHPSGFVLREAINYNIEMNCHGKVREVFQESRNSMPGN